MRLDIVSKILGFLVLGIAGIGVVPLLVSFMPSDSAGPLPWLGMIALALVVGGGLVGLGWKADLERLGVREGIGITSLVWLVASAVAGFGLFLAHPGITFVEGWFEAMSGFTTTGSSILGSDVPFEGLPPSIFIWRSLAQWMGGIGIVVISLALLPLLTGGSGFQLFKAEVPGVTADRLAPRIADTARLLLSFYLGLTGLVIVALLLCGVGLFDAVNHALTTVATGGFSTYANSVEGLNSAAAEWVIIIGMLVAGMNFGLLLGAMRGRTGRLFQNAETRVYLGILGISFAVVALVLGTATSFYDGEVMTLIRDSAFQVVTIMTSTGYATGYGSTPEGLGWEAWPAAAQFVLILLMIIGGCTGSTAGGTKVMRWIVVWKATKKEVARHAEPARISPVRIDKHPVRDQVVLQVAAFFVIYAITWMLGSLAFTLLGLDMTTSASLALTCLSNIGPGMGDVAVSRNFADIGATAQLLCIWLMLLGRLELISVLVIMTPRYWRK